MTYKGFMCNNKSLIQIEDLGRSNIILNICTIINKGMLNCTMSYYGLQKINGKN